MSSATFGSGEDIQYEAQVEETLKTEVNSERKLLLVHCKYRVTTRVTFRLLLLKL